MWGALFVSSLSPGPETRLPEPAGLRCWHVVERRKMVVDSSISAELARFRIAVGSRGDWCCDATHALGSGTRTISRRDMARAPAAVRATLPVTTGSPRGQICETTPRARRKAALSEHRVRRSLPLRARPRTRGCGERRRRRSAYRIIDCVSEAIVRHAARRRAPSLSGFASRRHHRSARCGAADTKHRTPRARSARRLEPWRPFRPAR
jgi:hypothetical protein